MTKKKNSSAFNSWELLCLSGGVEEGDTLLAQDVDGIESRWLWVGGIDRYSIYTRGEDGNTHRFFVATLEDHEGRMIVGLAKTPISLKDFIKK